jgi:hypothetical protein
VVVVERQNLQYVTKNDKKQKTKQVVQNKSYKQALDEPK